MIPQGTRPTVRRTAHPWWALCLLLFSTTLCTQTSPETVFLTFVAYRAAPGTAWQTPPLLRSGTDPVPAGQYAFQIVILNPREDMLPNALGLPDDKTWIAVHGSFNLDARAQIAGRDDLENAPLTGFVLNRLPFDQPVWIETRDAEGWARRGRVLVSPLSDYVCRLKGNSCDPNNSDLNFLSAVLFPDAVIGIPAAQGHPSATGSDVLVRLHRLLPAAARSVSARTTESLWQFWEPGAAPKETEREGRGARSLATLVTRTQNDISAMTTGASFQLAGYLTAPDNDHSLLVKHFADLVATLQTAAQSRDDGAADPADGSHTNGAGQRPSDPPDQDRNRGTGGTDGKPTVDAQSAADLNRMLTIVLLFLGMLAVVMAAWKAAMWWEGRGQDPVPQDGRTGQPAARRSAGHRFDPWAWMRGGAVGRHFRIGGGRPQPRPQPAHNDQMAAVWHSGDPQGGSSGHDRPRNEPSLGSFDSPPLNSPAPGTGRNIVYEVDSTANPEQRLLAIEQQLKSLAILPEKLKTALKTERDHTERTIVNSIATAIGQLRRDLEERYLDRQEVEALLHKLHPADRPEPDRRRSDPVSKHDGTLGGQRERGNPHDNHWAQGGHRDRDPAPKNANPDWEARPPQTAASTAEASPLALPSPESSDQARLLDVLKSLGALGGSSAEALAQKTFPDSSELLCEVVLRHMAKGRPLTEYRRYDEAIRTATGNRLELIVPTEGQRVEPDAHEVIDGLAVDKGRIGTVLRVTLPGIRQDAKVLLHAQVIESR